EHANFRVLQLLGIAAGEVGRHDDALMYLRKAADVAPGRPDVSFNMHHVLVLVGAAEADTLQQGREKVPTGWFVTPRGFLIAPDW
ncbi:MAG: hypothetical protein N2255_05930, partial [Kiritimatiellae bacterium]|nr:hypothetical protein [Kiritimatiellia bacterium]